MQTIIAQYINQANGETFDLVMKIQSDQYPLEEAWGRGHEQACDEMGWLNTHEVYVTIKA